ncbi:MAG: hypothetical protein BGN87_02215 [Rhizobiales bacterium 65-79]|jgi:uncharacterized protein (TIGR02186 family)|nr:TIGR02186 family protein [Hyphomicrobiales bacterium]OJU03338.1 MAG: hypothetical protein BGN87_02215 [Rhizobiales bacterium 65-79]
MNALRLAPLAVLAWIVLLPASALAQQGTGETIQIGLSADTIRITSDFSGADLTIFGSIDNVDPAVAREGGYDIIVVLEGPARPVVVRRKQRVFGMWINTESETFVNVPFSYSVALTRQPQDIAEPKVYRQLALGIDNIYMQPLDPSLDAATIKEFTAALRERKKASDLYSERPGAVQFLSQTLFRATVSLAPDVPVGTHRARAFLFKQGNFVAQTSAPLVILKGGFERRVYQFAQNDSFFYGVFCVLLALLTSWLGRVIFRKE